MARWSCTVVIGFFWGVRLLATPQCSMWKTREGPFSPAESARLLSFISWHWNFGVEKSKTKSTALCPPAEKKIKKLCLLQRYPNPWLSDSGLCCPRDWRLCPGKGCGGQKLVESVGRAVLGKSHICECLFFTLGLNKRLWSWVANTGSDPEEGEDGSQGMGESIPSGPHSLGRRPLPALSWVVHCSAGSLSVAALAGNGIARTAVVKTGRWLCSPLLSR